MGDQLFARLLAHPQLTPSATAEEALALGTDDNNSFAASHQMFEADFAEIMRRFEEEDRNLEGPAVLQATGQQRQPVVPAVVVPMDAEPLFDLSTPRAAV